MLTRRVASFVPTATLCCLVLLTSVLPARADSDSSANAAPTAASDGPAQVSGSGTLSTSLDLQLPVPRGDKLPVPVAVAYQGNSEMGAVGAGWDVPLSSIRISKTHSHRKPRAPGVGVTATSVPERVEMQLFGQSYLLRAVAPNVYRPLTSGEYLTVLKKTNAWEARDGHGHVYRFELLANAPDPDHYYLTQIIDVDGNYVALSYKVLPRAPVVGLSTDATPNATEISLVSVAYSHAGSCAKHRVELRYGAPNGGFYQLAYGLVGLVR